MPVKRRESSVEKEICDYARELGYDTMKFTSPGRRGVPDRALISPQGKVAFIEVKRPGGKLSPLQERELRKLREKNVSAEWFDNAREAIKWIDGLNPKP